MAKSAYISRILDAELGDLVRSVPAIVLEGPKGVGKTESASRLAKTIRRLDVPAERSVVAADPQRALEGERPAVAGTSRVGLREYVDEILRSGFPGLRGFSGRALRAQLDGYVARIVDPVPGWASSRNPLSRLTHPPKPHVADSALVARLLGATAASLLAGDDTERPGKGPLIGNLFESLVTLSIRVYAQAAEARVG